MSTPLYRDNILANNPDPADLQRKVWDGTPWIVDVYTGRESLGERDRDFAIRQWLHDNFGDQSWPFGKEPRTGRWFRGGATIHGWTWFGFATEADMQAFLAAWPNPEGDGSKQDREA